MSALRGLKLLALGYLPGFLCQGLPIVFFGQLRAGFLPGDVAAYVRMVVITVVRYYPAMWYVRAKKSIMARRHG